VRLTLIATTTRILRFAVLSTGITAIYNTNLSQVPCHYLADPYLSLRYEPVTNTTAGNPEGSTPLIPKHSTGNVQKSVYKI
jgi:hypothetical protein